MTRYVLPDLEYDYGALEPHISGRIMELHHGKHHRAYVDGANKALEQLHEARQKGSYDNVAPLARALAFNVSGHVLHSLFWRNLAPKAGGRPAGDLAQAIERNFGSFEAFKQQLSRTAATIMGSGWAALMWDTLSAQLLVAQIHDHQSSTIEGAVPLLVLDAWEHAYYLQYHNEKAKFFDAVWNVWNWNDVAQRFNDARRFGLHVKNVADLAA
ncbi:MAG TPA: superoxide dismutase [Steroidobacteraceae bacterium]|nr:superoxide dismutase [Steroidobacteraceae bacterium]